MKLILVGGLVAIFYFPIYWVAIIIPIDFHIFQRGSNHPPVLFFTVFLIHRLYGFQLRANCEAAPGRAAGALEDQPPFGGAMGIAMGIAPMGNSPMDYGHFLYHWLIFIEAEEEEEEDLEKRIGVCPISKHTVTCGLPGRKHMKMRIPLDIFGDKFMGEQADAVVWRLDQGGLYLCHTGPCLIDSRRPIH